MCVGGGSGEAVVCGKSGPLRCVWETLSSRYREEVS